MLESKRYLLLSIFYSGAWASGANDLNQWIQAEFSTPFKITAIQTQGRGGWNQWVKSYKVSYGIDGTNWRDINTDDGNKKVVEL